MLTGFICIYLLIGANVALLDYLLAKKDFYGAPRAYVVLVVALAAVIWPAKFFIRE